MTPHAVAGIRRLCWGSQDTRWRHQAVKPLLWCLPKRPPWLAPRGRSHAIARGDATCWDRRCLFSHATWLVNGWLMVGFVSKNNHSFYYGWLLLLSDWSWFGNGWAMGSLVIHDNLFFNQPPGTTTSELVGLWQLLCYPTTYSWYSIW